MQNREFKHNVKDSGKTFGKIRKGIIPYFFTNRNWAIGQIFHKKMLDLAAAGKMSLLLLQCVDLRTYCTSNSFLFYETQSALEVIYPLDSHIGWGKFKVTDKLVTFQTTTAKRSFGASNSSLTDSLIIELKNWLCVNS